jgi:AcrR family transcriptional regulator
VLPGKLVERAQALRSEGLTMLEIARELGVSKSSVSLWTRDVEFVPRRDGSGRHAPVRRAPNVLQRRKGEEIERLNAEGIARLGVLNGQAFLAAGAALYAGESGKGESTVIFANSDVHMMAFFCTWLRRHFAIEESRLTVRVYLHQGLDLGAAQTHWSRVTGVPLSQFRSPYRAVPDPRIRKAKHEFGCAYLRYCCTHTHRAIMGLVRALLSSTPIPG